MSLSCLKPEPKRADSVSSNSYLCVSFAVTTLAFTLASGYAFSAEWSAEPSVTLRQDYNDNINLTSAPHKPVWGTILSPAITFSGKSETLEVSGGAQLNFNRYTGAKGLDSDDRIFTFASKYSTERDVWGLSVYSKRDSTRATELASTGSVLPRAQRNALSINPSWTRTLTERMSLRLAYSLSDTKYDGGTSVGLVDSKSNAATASLIYLLGDTDKLSVSGTRSKFVSTSSSKSTTDEIRVGLTHDFSETLQGDAEFGVRRTTSTFLAPVYSCDFLPFGILPTLNGVCNFLGTPVPARLLYSPQTLTSRGTSLNLGLTQQFGGADTFTGRFSRDINPSGRGVTLQTDHLSLGYSTRFSETLSGLINTDFYRTRYQAIANQGSQYFTISPSLSWQLSEWWNLDTGVQYARQKYDGSATSVSSNLIYGSIRYNWPKISESR